MPHFYIDPDAPEEEQQKPKRKCDGLRQDLLLCVLKSSCVTKEKRTPKACLQDRDPSVEDCQYLVKALMECKRSLIDMRRRFRGERGY